MWVCKLPLFVARRAQVRRPLLWNLTVWCDQRHAHASRDVSRGARAARSALSFVFRARRAPRTCRRAGSRGCTQAGVEASARVLSAEKADLMLEYAKPERAQCADTRAPTALRPKRYTGYGHGAKYRGKRGVQGCKGRGKIGRKRKGSNRASPSFREREKMSEETG